MKNLFDQLTGSGKLLIVFTSICILMLSFACKPKHVQNTVKSIDSLLVIVNGLDQYLVQNNSDTIKFLAKFTKNDTDIFKSKLFDFPEDEELRKVFSNYTTIAKVFKRLSTNHRNIQRSIVLSQSQLENLKHDISNGLISSKDSIQIYYNKEAEAVRKLEMETKSFVERLNLNVDYFFEINPKLDEFKNEVKEFFPDKEFSKLPDASL